MKAFWLYGIILFQMGAFAQQDFEGTITDRYPTGEILEKSKDATENTPREITKYFKSGKRKSYLKIAKDDKDYWFRYWDEPGNVILDIIRKPYKEDPNYWAIAFKSYHSNGKLYQNGYFLSELQAIGNRPKVAVWNTFSRDSILKDKIEYNFWNEVTNYFAKGMSYYDSGQKKVHLEWDSNTRLFYYESYYKDGTRSVDCIFPLSALVSKHSPTLYELLRTDTAIKDLIKNLREGIGAVKYTIYYTNGKPYETKKKFTNKIIRLDTNGNTLYDIGGSFPPLPKGTTICDLSPGNKKRRKCNWLTDSDFIPKDGYYWIINPSTNEISLSQYMNGKKNRAYERYYRNGGLKELYHYVNDHRDGPFEERFENGALKKRGNYINDKLNGVLEEFTDHGILVSEGSYENGVRTGKWLLQFDTFKSAIGTMVDDQFEGETKIINPYTGLLLKEGVVKNGSKTGEWTLYNLDLETSYPNTKGSFGTTKIQMPNEPVFLKDEKPQSIHEFPIFPGCEGESNLSSCFNQKIGYHISAKLKFPKDAIGYRFDAQVIVKFIIDKTGYPKNIEVLSLRGDFDSYVSTESNNNVKIQELKKAFKNEAIRVISELPNITPGKSYGNQVSTPFVIPISFSEQ
ncbi:hypothetical protein [Aquimarina rubra]|uniref:TonB C-terminal domain-containing protein n=1 Tax=Aquimarina rubra TaxID=1920033 RepID=A0ABW5LKP1_9FLAO